NATKFAGNSDFAATFMPNGRPPSVGEVFTNRNLAESLRSIARGRQAAFYKGDIAARIVKFSQAAGGFHTLADFADQHSNWVEPLHVSYRGYTVYELPPNTQGLTALEMLNILEGYDVRALGQNSAEYLHLLVEAKKAAFVDRARHIADPAFYQAPIEQLLSKTHTEEMRQKIDLQRT